MENIERQINLSLNPQHLHKLHKQGYSWNKIATFYEVKERTIYRWIKPDNQPKQARGRKSKITKDAFSLLKSYIIKDNTATQQDMINFLTQQIGLTLHQSNMSRLLKKEGITRKKLTYHYTQMDEERAKAFNEEIKPLLAKYPFIALDECSFYPNLDPRFGYSSRGKRTVARKPGHKGKHYSLLFAISNSKKNGVVHRKLVEGGADWKVFYDFLEEINPIGNQKTYLLMDNAKIHYANRKRRKANLPSVKEQMARKNTEVLYITPYAPMLNATELCFNPLRQQTEKSRPRNYEEMKGAIEEAVKLLNTKDLSENFKHCAEYFDKVEL
jgi:transposase